MISTCRLVYQLKIVLLGISLMIWRRVLVSSNSTIEDLHHIMQLTAGLVRYPRQDELGVKPRGRVEADVAIPPLSNDPVRAISDGMRMEMPWLVTGYANKIAVGDGVLIWQAGEIG
ncbi:hypothetical protein [Ancylothrix sp. D3o]|uniref:IS1096 element passenger TnpR family protein n=1 Tax=Ancylothrix sp. D3o TaxID=2953691 RepID=UPI0035C8B10D